MSLDGFIAGPRGEDDWIPADLDFDWSAFTARFDTVVMGRLTWEIVRAQRDSAQVMRTYVISRTLDPAGHPGVTVSAAAAAPRPE
jgi:dihydrofolate reductase